MVIDKDSGKNRSVPAQILKQSNGFCDIYIDNRLHDPYEQTYKPPCGKTNNVVSEQVRHKSGCTATEGG